VYVAGCEFRPGLPPANLVEVWPHTWEVRCADGSGNHCMSLRLLDGKHYVRFGNAEHDSYSPARTQLNEHSWRPTRDAKPVPWSEVEVLAWACNVSAGDTQCPYTYSEDGEDHTCCCLKAGHPGEHRNNWGGGRNQRWEILESDADTSDLQTENAALTATVVESEERDKRFRATIKRWHERYDALTAKLAERDAEMERATLNARALHNRCEVLAAQRDHFESECDRLLACDGHRRNQPIPVVGCNKCVACLKLLQQCANRDKQALWQEQDSLRTKLADAMQVVDMTRFFCELYEANSDRYSVAAWLQKTREVRAKLPPKDEP